ncbi:bifunctional adenosylcobalamin biosynthesis protein CobP [Marinobacterium zhoushanense]|uniref:Bifunctional adenosylcobalamin biosynthesis protein n=1 Tax=Marinobacterium zhoushanense TaxID=1679163 RepID=A0ABQ1KL76_9GAMM|nr:bifunctional adenosylcobinamide kinase/adenosylcobinamide-phosphate guanylyltransferase [Marinobacterium zhoushanense]GGB98091.1 bifunctional adenosylcobalamin biosynthesis protein CobP [Marinobacterium zhoushanense]
MIRFITGGARCGKSSRAEQLAAASGLEVVYIATAEARDAEMESRLASHRARRPAHWRTIEEPLALAQVVRDQQGPERCLLVDCLTLWITNQLLAGADIRAERESLVAELARAQGEIILVSNETGMGVVPMGELSRRFVDESGWLHQAVAAQADQVVLMVAGLPLVVKGDRV